MAALPWDEIQLEATRVIHDCLPLAPAARAFHPPSEPDQRLHHPAAAAPPPPPSPSSMPAAALAERISRLEAGQREQQQKALAVAEAAHAAAQDGTRALRLAHRRLLLGRRGPHGRLTLDKLRVLIDTGLIFVGQEVDNDGQEEEGTGADGGQLAALGGLVEREAATRRRVARLEQENKRLVAEQQQLARLLARAVAALEALSVDSDAAADANVHGGMREPQQQQQQGEGGGETRKGPSKDKNQL